MKRLTGGIVPLAGNIWNMGIPRFGVRPSVQSRLPLASNFPQNDRYLAHHKIALVFVRGFQQLLGLRIAWDRPGHVFASFSIRQHVSRQWAAHCHPNSSYRNTGHVPIKAPSSRCKIHAMLHLSSFGVRGMGEQLQFAADTAQNTSRFTVAMTYPVPATPLLVSRFLLA